MPTRVVAGSDDRLFPLEFQRRVVRERLGLDVDVLPGGHLMALSRPRELADHLIGCCISAREIRTITTLCLISTRAPRLHIRD